MRLFLYGTLVAGSGNPLADRLHAKLAPGRPGHAIGRLYAVPDPRGWFPAFVPDPAGGEVQGIVHETAPDFTDADLAELDAYEGYLPDAPESSDFIRRGVTVQLTESGRTLDAEAYVWAKQVNAALVAIPGGDFRAFLAERGAKAFGASPG